MPKTAKPLTPQEIAELRAADANLWSNVEPTYINLINRLICDVSSDSIPEPLKGKIIVKIRQIGRDLEPYSA